MKSPTSQPTIERHSEHSQNASPVTRTSENKELIPEPAKKDWVVEVKTLLSEKMFVAVDSPDMNLLEAGLLDSLLIVELLTILEQQCGIAVPMMEVDIQDFSSVRRIAHLIESSASRPTDCDPGE